MRDIIRKSFCTWCENPELARVVMQQANNHGWSDIVLNAEDYRDQEQLLMGFIYPVDTEFIGMKNYHLFYGNYLKNKKRYKEQYQEVKGTENELHFLVLIGMQTVMDYIIEFDRQGLNKHMRIPVEKAEYMKNRRAGYDW